MSQRQPDAGGGGGALATTAACILEQQHVNADCLSHTHAHTHAHPTSHTHMHAHFSRTRHTPTNGTLTNTNRTLCQVPLLTGTLPRALSSLPLLSYLQLEAASRLSGSLPRVRASSSSSCRRGLVLLPFRQKILRRVFACLLVAKKATSKKQCGNVGVTRVRLRGECFRKATQSPNKQRQQQQQQHRQQQQQQQQQQQPRQQQQQQQQQ